MASDNYFKWNPSGYYEFMNSAGVTSDIERRLASVKRSANEGRSADSMDNMPFEGNVVHGDKKAIGICYTATPHGQYSQAKYDCLQTALYSARG